jgi:hypothetical protein
MTGDEMDEQVILLTSIRDILTRIERVLEKIEANGSTAAEPQPIPAPAPSAPTAGGPPTGGSKWRAR